VYGTLDALLTWAYQVRPLYGVQVSLQPGMGNKDHPRATDASGVLYAEPHV